MQIDILTLFPESVDAMLNVSILGTDLVGADGDIAPLLCPA